MTGKIVFLSLISAVSCFAQIKYNDLSAWDNVITNYARPTEKIVDASGNGDFTTISQAMSYADAVHATNATLEVGIHVTQGTYTENVTLNPRTILRGDNRRSKIWGTVTVVGTPCYLAGLYIRSTVAGQPALIFKDFTSSSVGTMSDCYVLNPLAYAGPSIALFMTNCTDSGWVNIDNSEFYVQNTSTDPAAKAIMIWSDGGGLELTASRFKTSTANPSVYDNEFMFWLTKNAHMQFENSFWLSVHDLNPTLHVDDTAAINWMDCSIINSESPLTLWRFEGTSTAPVTYYGKEVGNLKASNTVTASNMLTIVSGITNAVPVSKLSVSNTVYDFWVGYEGEYIIETNSTGGAVNGKMYFIRKQL